MIEHIVEELQNWIDAKGIINIEDKRYIKTDIIYL